MSDETTTVNDNPFLGDEAMEPDEVPQADDADPEADTIEDGDGDSAVQEPEPDEEASSDEAIPELDADTLAQAQEAGLSEDAAKALAQTGALPEVLGAMDRRLIELVQAGQPQPAQPEPENPPTEAEDDAPSASEDDGESEMDWSALEAELGEEPVAPLRERFAAQQREIAEIKAVLSAEREAATARANQEYVTWFDSAIANLGDDWAKTFGEGTVNDIAPDGPEMQARLKLDRAMDGLCAAFPNTPKQQLFHRALRAVFDTKETRSSGKSDDSPRDAAGRFTRRPAQRAGDSGFDAWLGDEDAEETMSGFPD